MVGAAMTVQDFDGALVVTVVRGELVARATYYPGRRELGLWTVESPRRTLTRVDADDAAAAFSGQGRGLAMAMRAARRRVRRGRACG